MSKLIFIDYLGAQFDFDVEQPTTAMAVARLNNVSGIEAECGGALSCGTCHVYVDPADMEKISAPSADEEEMLDLVAAERTSTSRLCCQIPVSGATGSLTLHIPKTQF